MGLLKKTEHENLITNKRGRRLMQLQFKHYTEIQIDSALFKALMIKLYKEEYGVYTHIYVCIKK